MSEDLKRCEGWVSSKLEYDGDKLILFLTERFDDFNRYVKIEFLDLLIFHDVGFIGSAITFVDVCLPGFKGTSIARQKGIAPENLRQIVFITKKSEQKRELIVVCRDINVDFSRI